MGDLKIGWIIAAVLGLAVAVLAASLHRQFRHDITDAYQRLKTGGSVVAATDCGPIEYAALGDGQPILVVHGIVGGFDQGVVVAEGHLPDGYQAIVPSRFGYLDSPLPDSASTADQADAFACLLDAVDVDRVPVLATSAGATSAINFALRHPDRCSCLVLISPNAPGDVDVAPPPRPVANAIYRSDFAFWVVTKRFRSAMTSMMGVPKGFELTPEYEAAIDDVVRTVLPIKPRADGVIFDLYISNPSINKMPLENVAVPVFIANALDDPLALYENSKAMAERIPGAKLLTIEDGGHMMLGHDEEIRAEIAAFLAESCSAGP